MGVAFTETEWVCVRDRDVDGIAVTDTDRDVVRDKDLNVVRENVTEGVVDGNGVGIALHMTSSGIVSCTPA